MCLKKIIFLIITILYVNTQSPIIKFTRSYRDPVITELESEYDYNYNSAYIPVNILTLIKV
jgi:hypothetical protein